MLGLTATGCASTFQAGAAIVNGVRITQAQLDAAVKASSQQAQPGQSTVDSQRSALMNLIQDEILREAGIKRHLLPTDAAVEQQIDSIRQRLGADFDTQLKAAGFTLASLRVRVRDSLIQQALAKKIAPPVTDAQIKQVYDAQKDQYQQVNTKHILIAVDQNTTDKQAKALALNVLDQLRKGASFKALAKKYSDDPGSKDSGGNIGFQPVSGLDPAYAQAAESAKVGALIGPIRSQFGYHIIVTLAKRTQPISEVGPQLRQQLEAQVGQRALTDFVQGELRHATIDVNPRYGDWDPGSDTIVPHQGYQPASPALDQSIPQPNIPFPAASSTASTGQ